MTFITLCSLFARLKKKKESVYVPSYFLFTLFLYPSAVSLVRPYVEIKWSNVKTILLLLATSHLVTFLKEKGRTIM